MFASSRAALRYYKEFTSDRKQITIHNLLNMAGEGNTSAKNALIKQAQYIGKGLRSIVTALAPELILLAGDITSAWDLLSPFIVAEMTTLSLAASPPRLAPAYEGGEARLRGAAALVLQRHSGHSTPLPLNG
jgi:predicted NBD/HSP70 family sugar kinase